MKVTEKIAEKIVDKITVQKYGGATLSDPKKIRGVAKRISESHSRGEKLIIVVSAMGKATNSLIDLARAVSSTPPRRELDMLLSTGERISMSLVSIALQDFGCPAISFTGSQAGILTDESHLNAFIQDIKPLRIQEALDANKVVVLAGFQGVSPISREITTLGRGGSDTSAVAIASCFQGRCEILKDVPSVFTADPKIVPTAKPLATLRYSHLLNMAFWGAKVLHYRSVELAMRKKVPLYIGPAHDYNTNAKTNNGTFVYPEETKMPYESTSVLAINSHSQVVKLNYPKASASEALTKFKTFVDEKQIGDPHILFISSDEGSSQIFVTGPDESIATIEKQFEKHFDSSTLSPLSTVTLTCCGSTAPELISLTMNCLSQAGVVSSKIINGPMSLTVVIPRADCNKAIEALHALVKIDN